MRDTGTHQDVRAVRDLFAAHDPAADHPVDPVTMERNRVEVIAASPRRRRNPFAPDRGFLLRPAVLGTAAAIVAAATLIPFVFQGSPPAHATPPPLPLEVTIDERTEAAPRLFALAEAAESAQAPPRDGDVAYVHTLEWTFTYAQNADDGRTGWGILPEDRRVWRAPDESGVEVVVTGEADHRGGDRGPLDFLTGRGSERFVWGDGEGGDGMFFTWDPSTLPTDPEELERRLLQGTGYDAGTPEATLFYALQTLYTEAPIDPEVQAAVLRLLVEHDGVRYAGEHEDRQGREGELFVVEDTGAQDDGTLERRIMFDPDTGMPLYFEVVTVETESGEVEGEELPMMNHYAVISESAWVAEVEERP
ncbi:CU044_5270 family protein [Nocardiopsis alba]|uniref:CU044_5270 family protein n=1 Tax=Nocardiopsis alba TaxID=53437 RepID=UPI0033A6C599